MKEKWKFIDGYTGYQISNYGRVKSIKFNNKFLVNSKNRCGYLFVGLYKNKRIHCYIHRLVAWAFLPNPEMMLEVNHIDGNKQNNRVDNLEWVTHSENMKHAFETGLINQNGENSVTHKLSDNNVLAIYILELKYSQRFIARMYNVSRTCIEHILNGKRRNHF